MEYFLFAVEMAQKEETSETGEIYDKVQEYYGKIIKKTSDLQTKTCCTKEKFPEFALPILTKIHQEVQQTYYGCGVVIPELLEGLKVLDLGSGSGRDVYLLSGLVGAKGYVIGVDMTDEQLNVANKYLNYHAQQFGYAKGNVEFKKGYIEKLDLLDLKEGTFDLIISNCVVNLSPDKEAVLKHAFRLLKPGGEMYFSDIYSDRRIPSSLAENSDLWGECLSGALYWNDFLSLCRKVGFKDPRLVKSSPVAVQNPGMQRLIGHIQFWSATYRLWKIPALEEACEDYGEAIQYKGSIPYHPNGLQLDGHHYFETGKVVPVCRNTRLMLSETRFKSHFNFYNAESNVHYGIFKDCGVNIPFSAQNSSSSSCDLPSCC